MNPFDTLKQPQSLQGSFSKKLKKGLKKVDSTRRKVLKKTLGKKLYAVQSKVGAKIKKNPVAAGVIAVAASVVLSPAAGAAIMKVALAAKKLMTAKNLVGAAKVAGAVKKRKQQKAVAKAVQKAEAMRNQIDQSTPEFGQMVDNLRAQGYSDEQIQQTWAQSQAYVDTTAQAAVQDYSQAAYDHLISQGYSSEDAQTLAPDVAAQWGKDAALTVRSSVAGGGMLVYLVGAGLLLTLL